MPCNINPRKLENEIKVGASRMGQGFEKWSKSMTETFGPEIKPYLSDIHYHSKGIYRIAQREAMSPTRDAQAGKRYENMEREMREKISHGDLAREVRVELKLTTETAAKKRAYEDARHEFDVMLQKKQMEQMGYAKKKLAQFVSLGRWAKLTGIQTMIKIGGAVVMRSVQAVSNATVSSIAKRTPILGRIAKTSGAEGAGLSTLPAYFKGMGQGLKRIPGVMTGKYMTKENMRPSYFTGKVQSALDVTSIRLHQAGKEPARFARQTQAKEFYTKEAKKQGKDITDPEVEAAINEAALADGYRHIFMSDNLASSGLNSMIRMMEHSKKFPVPGLLAARAAQFIFPIVRVPTNIAGEAVSMGGGAAVMAPIRFLNVIRQGISKASVAEKSAFMRSLQNGAIGGSFFIAGYLNYKYRKGVGGFYHRGEERKPGELRELEADVFGVKLPKEVMHSPPALVFQAGGEVAKQMEEKFLKGGPKEGKSATEAYAAAQMHIFQEVPFIREAGTVDALLGEDAAKGIAGKAGSMGRGMVPQAVQNVAQWTDTHDIEGYSVKRKPTGIGEQVKMGIPWWRKTVPTREEVKHSKKKSFFNP